MLCGVCVYAFKRNMSDLFSGIMNKLFVIIFRFGSPYIRAIIFYISHLYTYIHILYTKYCMKWYWNTQMQHVAHYFSYIFHMCNFPYFHTCMCNTHTHPHIHNVCSSTFVGTHYSKQWIWYKKKNKNIFTQINDLNTFPYTTKINTYFSCSEYDLCLIRYNFSWE